MVMSFIVIVPVLLCINQEQISITAYPSVKNKTFTVLLDTRFHVDLLGAQLSVLQSFPAVLLNDEDKK